MANWRSELGEVFQTKEAEANQQEEERIVRNAEISRFYAEIVHVAFEELKAEVEKYGRKAEIDKEDRSSSITITHRGELELAYTVRVSASSDPVIPYPQIPLRDKLYGNSFLERGSFSEDPAQPLTIKTLKKETIITHFLDSFRKYARDTAS